MSFAASRWATGTKPWSSRPASLPSLRTARTLTRLGTALRHRSLGSQRSREQSVPVGSVHIEGVPEGRVIKADAEGRGGCRVAVLSLSLLLLGISMFGPGPAMASTGEKLVASIQGKVPDWLIVLFISAFPIVELRGAIPVSVAMLGMDPLRVLPLAVVGNMIPVPFILLFLGPLSTALSRFAIFKRLFDKIFERSRNQGAAWKKNEFWALTFFVGLPLPGTGAWSGAIGAFVLGMPFGKALLANFTGVCLAGAIVTSLTMLGWKGLIIAILAFIVLPAIAVLRGQQEPRSATE